MEETGILKAVGWSAVALVVACWVVVSFARTAAVKRRLAWVGACGMYVALLCLFTNLFVHADGHAGRIAFGFLMALFGTGLCLSLWKTATAFSGEGAGGDHATH